LFQNHCATSSRMRNKAGIINESFKNNSVVSRSKGT
jgi:hypothetical protein